MSLNVFDEQEKGQNLELSILVADDDALNQRMMQLILGREGYHVSIASNGEEAVELARSQNFDVILMDLQMPVLDGMGASRLIREWEKDGKHTFIVALTASYLPEKGQELFNAGIDNYISKPFDLEHLRHILRYSHHTGKKPSKEALTQPPSTPGFSVEMGLHRLGGSEDVFRDLLGDFIQELPGKLEKLDTCHQKNELEQLSRHAHNLKGVAASLGAIQLSERAGDLEKLADSRVLEEIRHIIELTRAAANDFQKSASKYLIES